MKQEEQDTFQTDTQFDLYTHLKINIKTSSPFCELHESKYTHYCLNCKRSVCEVCKDSFHNNHSLQVKDQIQFESKQLDFLFKDLEDLLKSTRVFSEPERMKKELIFKVNEEFDTLKNLLDDLKRRKIREIELIFSDTENSKTLLDNINATRSLMFDFFNKYNKFFYSDDVKDEDNSIFLFGYDMFNEGVLISNEYKNAINQIRSYYETFEDSKNKKTREIHRAVQSALEEEKKSEILSTNLMVISNNDITADEKIGTNSNQDNFKMKVLTNLDKIGEDLYKDLKEKVTKMNEFLEGFKKSTYDSFKKHGSLVDIEKTVKVFDEKTNKRTNFVKSKANLIFSPSQAKAYSISGALPSQAKMMTKGNLIIKDNPNEDGQTEEKLKKNSAEKSPPKKEAKLLKDMKKGEVPIAKLAHFSSTERKDYKALLAGQDGVMSELEERTEDEGESNSHQIMAKPKDDHEEKAVSSDDEQNLFENEDNYEVKLEDGFYKKPDKKRAKLEKMFKPLLRENPKKPKSKPDKKAPSEEEKAQFKVNNKLQETIKENQRLCSMIRKQDDINLVISTIRRYYSYQLLDFVRKNLYKVNKPYSSNLLFSSAVKEETNNNDTVKVFEGTNEMQIYDRENRRLIRKSLALDKKTHGANIFLDGCRTYYYLDKLYITGGRDSSGDKKLFWLYNLKDNKLSILPSMNHARSYHSMTFHENLKSIVVIGGENNKFCEMYDFFLNAWSDIPELNQPRANISLHIDKIGTFAYAIGGIVGNISSGVNSDAIELLDFVDINQGWAKVDYRNKANVDLKFSQMGVYPLTDDKLLIYGGGESRNVKKCYVIFDLRTFDILNVDQSTLEEIRIHANRNPELEKFFL